MFCRSILIAASLAFRLRFCRATLRSSFVSTSSVHPNLLYNLEMMFGSAIDAATSIALAKSTDCLPGLTSSSAILLALKHHLLTPKVQHLT